MSSLSSTHQQWQKADLRDAEIEAVLSEYHPDQHDLISIWDEATIPYGQLSAAEKLALETNTRDALGIGLNVRKLLDLIGSPLSDIPGYLQIPPVDQKLAQSLLDNPQYRLLGKYAPTLAKHGILPLAVALAAEALPDLLQRTVRVGVVAPEDVVNFLEERKFSGLSKLTSETLEIMAFREIRNLLGARIIQPGDSVDSACRGFLKWSKELLRTGFVSVGQKL